MCLVVTAGPRNASPAALSSPSRRTPTRIPERTLRDGPSITRSRKTHRKWSRNWPGVSTTSTPNRRVVPHSGSPSFNDRPALVAADRATSRRPLGFARPPAGPTRAHSGPPPAPSARATARAEISPPSGHGTSETRKSRPIKRSDGISSTVPELTQEQPLVGCPRVGVACTESGMVMTASRNITDRFPAVRRLQVVKALCARHTSAWNREVVHRGVQGPSVQMYQGPLKCSYQTSSGPGTRSGM